MRHKSSSFVGLAMALLLVSACSSGGGLGDILGGGSNNQNGMIRGTVDRVDLSSRSIYLVNVSGYNSMLSNGGGGGSTVRVYFDEQTAVTYQNQGYRPEDLERGDEVDVQVNESGNVLVADRVTVLRDATAGNASTYPGGTYGSTMRGTVRYVDTSRRTIELDRGYGSTTIIEYDTRTPVTYGGRGYNVADLERGDEIDIRVTDLGNGRYRADDISVVRSVSDNGTYNNGTATATVRGTVRYVDTARRTIELEQATGISGFNTGVGGSTLVVQYGTNAQVEMGGRGYPVTGLERGDVIDVQVDRSGSTYFANRIFLVRDVNAR